MPINPIRPRPITGSDIGPQTARFLGDDALARLGSGRRAPAVVWSPARRPPAYVDRVLIALALFSVTTTSFAIVSELGWPRGADATDGLSTPPPSPLPHVAEAEALARATLLALDDANRTGNYTVLRERAAPGFQALYSAEELARIFSGHRALGLDLAAVATGMPRWLAPPGLDADGLFRLTGAFALDPAHDVRFDFAYLPLAGRWRLIDIAVTPEAAAPAK